MKNGDHFWASNPTILKAIIEESFLQDENQLICFSKYSLLFRQWFPYHLLCHILPSASPAKTGHLTKDTTLHWLFAGNPVIYHLDRLTTIKHRVLNPVPHFLPGNSWQCLNLRHPAPKNVIAKQEAISKEFFAMHFIICEAYSIVRKHNDKTVSVLRTQPQ